MNETEKKQLGDLERALKRLSDSLQQISDSLDEINAATEGLRRIDNTLTNLRHVGGKGVRTIRIPVYYGAPRHFHSATEYHTPAGGKRVKTGRYG